jgi:predicted RNase H-like nuclease (RuvC/YqgF family)
LVWLALFLSLVACGLSAFFYWKSQRNQELSVERFSDRVSGLLSEFNSVTQSKVDLLDDRTEELRRIVDLANLKIKKLNQLIDQVEAVENTLDEPANRSEPLDSSGDQSGQARVLELANEGKSLNEIAEITDLTPGEISVILKVNQTELEETVS